VQEKEQKISPIKQRILHFVANLGISKREFYARTGISRGTLESNTGITEDILAKFIATYPEVNIQWLLTGDGEPTCQPEDTNAKKDDLKREPGSDSALAAEIVKQLTCLASENARLKVELETLREGKRVKSRSHGNYAAEP